MLLLLPALLSAASSILRFCCRETAIHVVSSKPVIGKRIHFSFLFCMLSSISEWRRHFVHTLTRRQPNNGDFSFDGTTPGGRPQLQEDIRMRILNWPGEAASRDVDVFPQPLKSRPLRDRS